MFGYSRQCYYRSLKSRVSNQQRAIQVVSLVQDIRIQMPRIGTIKLYYLLKPQLDKLGVGRDKLFSILRANKMLIKRQKSYHVTTNSHHRFKKQALC